MNRRHGWLLIIMIMWWSPTIFAAHHLETFFKTNDVNSSAEIDHTAWQKFINKYVYFSEEQEQFFVDYDGVTPVDQRELNHYLISLQQTPIRQYHPDEQKAYWINLYNALVVRVILDHYPVWSVRDINISPSAFERGPYGAKLVRIEGQAVSLNEIYHSILMPIYHDPRVHYALSCGARGCGDVLEEAYMGRRLNIQLNLAAKRFIQSTRGVSFDTYGPVLSSIYDWYVADFGGTQAGVVLHLIPYLLPEAQEKIKNNRGKMAYQFDWGLNSEF